MNNLEEVRSRALKFLARREYSQQELFQKLISRGADSELAFQAVDELTQNNMVNDERFAVSLIRVRMTRGYGPVKIESELKNRGVSPELIVSCLDIDDEQWQSQIMKVTSRKYRDLPIESFQDWAKRANFLRSRGFTSAQIRDALGEYSGSAQSV